MKLDLKKQIAFLSVVVLMFLFLTGCGQPQAAASAGHSEATSSEDTSVQLFSERAMLQEIGRVDRADYGVYASEMLDVYLIACALYFDFQCPEILPEVEGDPLAAQVKDYFLPYQNHPFIEGLNPYVDGENRAQRDGVVQPLLMYAFSMVDYQLDVTMVQTDVFADGEAFQAFLKALYGFYQDTEANAFFRSLQPQKDLVSYLQTEMAHEPIEPLFAAMEEYVGKQGAWFGDKTVKYRSVMTLYRPFYASFYTIDFGQEIYSVAQQSPHDEGRSTQAFCMEQAMNTAIHEFLHTLINPLVYEQNALIQRLAEDQRKSDYISPMYQSMEWHRIVDEHLVRAVETAIYSEVIGEQEAVDLILNKEIQSGQMPKLQGIYQALSLYAAERDLYPSIDAYLPVLIAAMFGETV